MAKVSFIDQGSALSACFIARDYKPLAERIAKEKEKITCYIERDGVIAGYQVASNHPLTELFESPFFAVRFLFAGIDTMHGEEQEKILVELFTSLKEYMDSHKGYYNLRIPSHIVDAIKAYNQVMSGGWFCGGTVEELISGKQVELRMKEGLSVFWADQAYVDRHKDLLLEMTLESFRTYQGQYHISPATQDKAGIIYENWIRQSLDNCREHTVMVAQYEDRPIGFVTVEESETAVDGILSAVDNTYRQYGAYRAMITSIVNYAHEKQKAFITSTQFDNFIVQGVWNSIGLKPYYSIYNFHIDKR